MRSVSNWIVLVLGVVVAAASAGCCARREAPSASLTEKPTPARKYHRKPLVPVVDTKKPSFESERQACETSDQCVSELKTMLADKSRSWIGKPQSTAEHFAGTRQFAYIALSKSLRCTELKAGLADIEASARHVEGKHRYSSRQVDAIRVVNDQARGDLAREIGSRCPQ